jgi:hypothetical protein
MSVGTLHPGTHHLDGCLILVLDAEGRIVERYAGAEDMQPRHPRGRSVCRLMTVLGVPEANAEIASLLTYA